MKPIRIDFATRTIRQTIARTRPVTWVAGGIGMLLCASAAIAALNVTQQQTRVDAQVRLQKTLAERTASKPAAKKMAIPETQAAAVNSAIAQLNLPWRDVLDAVEAATPATIALLALEPDATKHLVRGLAEAKSSDGMVAYIEQLKQQAFFDAVVLTKHEINEQDPNKPLRFQFEAQWAKVAP